MQWNSLTSADRFGMSYHEQISPAMGVNIFGLARRLEEGTVTWARG